MVLNPPSTEELKRRKDCLEASQQFEYWNRRYMNWGELGLSPEEVKEARKKFHYWNRRYVEFRNAAN